MLSFKERKEFMKLLRYCSLLLLLWFGSCYGEGDEKSSLFVTRVSNFPYQKIKDFTSIDECENFLRHVVPEIKTMSPWEARRYANEYNKAVEKYYQAIEVFKTSEKTYTEKRLDYKKILDANISAKKVKASRGLWEALQQAKKDYEEKKEYAEQVTKEMNRIINEYDVVRSRYLARNNIILDTVEMFKKLLQTYKEQLYDTSPENTKKAEETYTLLSNAVRNVEIKRKKIKEALNSFESDETKRLEGDVYEILWGAYNATGITSLWLEKIWEARTDGSLAILNTFLTESVPDLEIPDFSKKPLSNFNEMRGLLWQVLSQIKTLKTRIRMREKFQKMSLGDPELVKKLDKKIELLKENAVRLNAKIKYLANIFKNFLIEKYKQPLQKFYTIRQEAARESSGLGATQRETVVETFALDVIKQKYNKRLYQGQGILYFEDLYKDLINDLDDILNRLHIVSEKIKQTNEQCKKSIKKVTQKYLEEFEKLSYKDALPQQRRKEAFAVGKKVVMFVKNALLIIDKKNAQEIKNELFKFKYKKFIEFLTFRLSPEMKADIYDDVFTRERGMQSEISEQRSKEIVIKINSLYNEWMASVSGGEKAQKIFKKTVRAIKRDFKKQKDQLTTEKEFYDILNKAYANAGITKDPRIGILRFDGVLFSLA